MQGSNHRNHREDGWGVVEVLSSFQGEDLIRTTGNTGTAAVTKTKKIPPVLGTHWGSNNIFSPVILCAIMGRGSSVQMAEAVQASCSSPSSFACVLIAQFSCSLPVVMLGPKPTFALPRQKQLLLWPVLLCSTGQNFAQCFLLRPSCSFEKC